VVRECADVLNYWPENEGRPEQPIALTEKRFCGGSRRLPRGFQ
jgi:hypothetical protein